jgi:hypothetical protein
MPEQSVDLSAFRLNIDNRRVEAGIGGVAPPIESEPAPQIVEPKHLTKRSSTSDVAAGGDPLSS